MIGIEEQRAKQLPDDVLGEYMSKDTGAMWCTSKYVEEIRNQYIKTYDVINTIKDNFSAAFKPYMCCKNKISSSSRLSHLFAYKYGEQ